MLPPPEGSPWADPTGFYSHLTSQIYINSTVNCIIITGDFNARLGKEPDIASFDSVNERKVLDPIKNSYGDSLIDFLKDVQFCVTNGRVSPDLDNFTSVGKGKAVVDYTAVPHDCLKLCKKCEVKLMTDLIEDYNLLSLLSGTCKTPDHSVISLTFGLKIEKERITPSKTINNNKTSFNESIIPQSKRFKFDQVSSLFMNNSDWVEVTRQIVTNFQNLNNEQIKIDLAYSDMCNKIFSEADKHLDYHTATKSVRKRFKYHKPWWTTELSTLWKNMKEKEQQFLKQKNSSHSNNTFYQSFKLARQKFDKVLRQTERAYSRKVTTNLEHITTTNPREFWNTIKSMGPRKQNIPFTVYKNDTVELTDDIEYVKNKWKNDFDGLYKRSSEANSDFHQNIKYQKTQFEYQMLNGQLEENDFLNDEITTSEIKRVINGLKARKTPGIDGIQNELLSNDNCLPILSSLFNKCFESGKIPSIWLKAIVVPIPKGAEKDPHVPLNYRGISLISCVSKIYSAVLNNRINSYTDMIGIIAEEQNGFRRGRSCEDHIFTLTSMIQNRLNASKDTFACFIDMKKAFDWVDRDLLFFKLLNYNITGKIYWAIKSLYTNTKSCIQLHQTLTDWFSVSNGVK